MGKKSVETLWAEMQAARDAYMTAVSYTDGVISEVPTGIPGDDGIVRIRRAGAIQEAAFQNYRDALDRYSNAVALRNQRS